MRCTFRAIRPLAVLAYLAGATACNDRQPQPPPSRYEAVKSAADPSAKWCDATFGQNAPKLSLPPLADEPRPLRPLSAGKRVWLNVWATWCKPCLRELPLLRKWQSDMHKDGVDLEPVFLSLDEDAEVLAKFLAEHKELPAAQVVRAKSQQQYEQWIKAYLSDTTTPIPIHLLASADGHVRCVRSGSLREGDYPAAKAALR